MSSAAVSSHSSSAGAGPLSLMSCVRESSPRQDFDAVDSEKITSKRRFWNPKKWFKRKHKVSDDALASGIGGGDGSPMEIGNEALRSRSTSELSVTDEQSRRRSAASIQQGLSVSHDSVFHSPHSGSDMELEAAQSSSSLSTGSHPHHIDHRLQTELSERLRLRRGRGDTSEDDEGLPHSPCNSPTTTEGLLDKTAIKDLPTKSHSTCSDGSFLSMGSSEMDEDSFGLHSRHSSKLSLHEKKTTEDGVTDLELGSSASFPLNHSAAHHRVAVRPKKTHGAPRRKRAAQLSSALPATPEVNEDSSIRSITPENIITKESITEVYSRSTHTVTESQIKCSSLPPGIQPPDTNNKLNRSKSNASAEKAQKSEFTTVIEEKSTEDKSDKSFFDRIFPRKSAKKKKLDEKKAKESENSQTKSYSESTTSSVTVVTTSSNRINKKVESKPIAAPRSGPASRQRIQPIELPPASPELDFRKDVILPKPSPEKSISAGTSPLQMELENRFKLRQSTSPISLPTPPHSPKSPTSSDLPQFAKDLPQFPKDLPKSPQEFRKSPNNYRKSSRDLPKSPKSPKSPKFHIISPEKSFEFSSKFEKQARNESRRKVHIAGLTSLQQRVLSLNDDEFDGFKSLSDLPSEKSMNSNKITKSHSFKTTNSNRPNITKDMDEEENRVTKAASLDSVKVLDEPKESKYQSECKFEFKSESQSQKPKKDYNDKYSEEVKKNFVNNLNDFGITISGPSHTAVVNITNNYTDSKTTETTITEQLKRTENLLTKTEKISSQKEKYSNGERIINRDENDKYQSDNFDKSTNHCEDFLNSEKLAENCGKSLNSEKETLAESTKENQVSVTKIQVKREVTQVTSGFVTLPNSEIPEFISKQLNKVDRPGSSNVVFSMNSPRIIEEMKKQPRPKTLDISSNQSNNQMWPRKFSQDNLEIIEKDVEVTKKESENNNFDKSSPTTPTTPVTPRFKKNDSKTSSRKSSVASITPDPPKKFFKSRSVSLDSLKSSDISDKSSSQDSLDKLDEKTPATSIDEPPVILRRKSQMRRDDDQPELMKVFARRSLKLKDTESETISDKIVASLDTDNDNSAKIITRDSDKENQESPIIERKVSKIEEKKKLDDKRKVKEDLGDKKEPLIETKTVTAENEIAESVALRKANNSFPFPRSVSLNPPPVTGRKLNEAIFRNQSIYIDKVDEERMKVANDVINEDLITESKNFNQRKAEWEKRAQLAQKKNVP